MILPPQLREKIGHKNVIVFDGVCVLCNLWVKFVLRFDTDKQFHFIIAQTDLGEQFYSALGLKSDDYDSFIVVKNTQITTSLDGVFTLFATLGWPWKALCVFRILPSAIKDFMYQKVARNRYAIFGKRDTCIMPSPDIRARFFGRFHPIMPGRSPISSIDKR